MPRRLPILTDEDRYTLAEHPRPKTREDCLEGGSNADRPCPWVGCKWHLGIEVRGNKIIEIANWDDGRETCALDVADHGEVTALEVAKLLGTTENAVYLTEIRAKRKLKQKSREMIDE